MDLAQVVIAVGSIAAFLLLLAMVRRGVARTRRAREAWRAFAALRGLHAEPAEEGEDDVRFAGSLEGLPVAVERLVRQGKPVRLGPLRLRRGDALSVWTHMRVGLPGLSPGLRLSRESFLDRVGALAGLADVKTGDPDFDRTFAVRGQSPDEVRGYLTPERRRALVAFRRDVGPVEVVDGALVLEREGEVEGVAELERLFSRLADLARLLAPSPRR